MTQFFSFRTATTAVAAIAAATLAVSGAVTPVHASTVAAPAPVAPDMTHWQQSVEASIASEMRSPDGLHDGDLRVVQMGIDFDAAGNMIATRILKPSGLDTADAEARRIARTIAYPRLPVLMQGKPVTVAMELYFSTTSTNEQALAAAAERREQTGSAIARIESTVRQAENAAANPAG